ncbi:acetyl-CoA C-acetyltransferase [Bacillus sp. FJAT-45350]|uniref:acetyl-CoA C-acetyltransferase n=1 Tax=Bacillus sp. FJAT-45350 TaxID=2011014 RepID=UPI000BB7A7F7|nr:acetyl-CoA C-acetyltransferase [Bacillus sp. FJAT-45350]
MGNVYLVDGARTAIGSFGKSLKDITAIELGIISAKEAITRSQVKAEEIDQIVYGNVIHSNKSASYLARHIGLNGGIPIETPAMIVNRLCGSGMQALVSASQSILLGESNLALAGGAENMSMSPHVQFSSRFSNVKYGPIKYEDMLLNTLTDQYIGCGVGITAENLAKNYSITRKEQDEYALVSQKRAEKAIVSGIFSEEIVPVEVSNEKKHWIFEEDEHVKKGLEYESLAKQTPAFIENGSVTSGNSSGINDGAASVILASEAKVSQLNARPMAKIVSWGISGVDPSVMGIGPVPAIKQALKRAELTIGDIDRFEINEAFASQYLAVEKELKLDRDKTNVHGGAIALGHPVGMSGTRIVLSLAYELRRNNLKYGVASLCIGGGQGIAMIIENEDYSQ